MEGTFSSFDKNIKVESLWSAIQGKIKQSVKKTSKLVWV
jgi:hypothetical protein